jgi:hypothetical protein
MTYPDKDKRKKVQRLVDVDVTHVSLVDRPANRTPFKFVKRDDGTETGGTFPMNITLKNLFGSRPAEVTSVIADTQEKAVAVAKAIMDCETVTVDAQDGLFVARKTGSQPSADERLIHLGKATGVAYTVGNLKKELVLYDMEGTDGFEDAVKKEGFVPGLMVGMEALNTTIRNIAMSEDTNDAEAFRSKVGKAIEDFGAYVGSLIDALPAKAFKFEKALVAVAPRPIAAPATPEGFNSEVYDMIFGKPPAPASAAAVETAPAQTAQEAPQDAASAKDGETPAETASAAPAPADAQADAKPANFEELPAGTEVKTAPDFSEALNGVVAELTKNLGQQIAEAIKPLNEQVAAQGATIATLSKAVGGAVASTPDADDDGNVVRLTKGASPVASGEPPLMDTAYRTNRG